MNRASSVVLSPAQAKALWAVAEGEVIRRHDMGWFQKGGFDLRGGRAPHPATMEKLHDLGLIRYASKGPSHDDVILTPEGEAFIGR